MAQKDVTLRPALKSSRKILPPPSDEELKKREKGFLLDGTLLSRQANDETDRCNPSYLNFGIPQYNALKDPHLKRYLKTNKSLPKSFQRHIEEEHTDTMQGMLLDRLTTGSHTLSYIKERNSLVGAGYNRDMYGGHLSVKTAPPNIGYHGEDGYRRNTPDLRRRKSVFDDEGKWSCMASL